MFAYCGNNPCSHIDYNGGYSINIMTEVEGEDEDGVIYKTIITVDTRRKLLGIIPVGSVEEHVFYYSVSNSGIVSFDNSQQSAQILLYENNYDIELFLAAEMLRVAREQIPGALNGRTYYGVAFELTSHYAGYALGVKLGHTNSTEIGSNDINSIGYDNNADLFEHPFSNIKGWVEMLF